MKAWRLTSYLTKFLVYLELLHTDDLMKASKVTVGQPLFEIRKLRHNFLMV